MKDRESLASGAIFFAVGSVCGLTTMLTLPIGSAFSMGPGYFPLVLSGLLALLGAAILIRGFRGEGSHVFGPVPWRALVMISLAILCFAFFIRSLGLFPTALLTTLLACAGNGGAGLLKAAALSLIMAALCTLIFSFGIGLPIPIFGSWLGGYF